MSSGLHWVATNEEDLKYNITLGYKTTFNLFDLHYNTLALKGVSGAGVLLETMPWTLLMRSGIISLYIMEYVELMAVIDAAQLNFLYDR